MDSLKMRKISILAVSLIVVSGAAIGANLPAIAQTFPEIPLPLVEMLTTIPALFIIPAVLLSTKIAKCIGYKKSVLLGLGIVLISGIIPAIVTNFAIIFISRACFGFGIGMFNSLLISIISYFYHGNERAAAIGFQSAFEGIGGMSLTFVVGQLLKINWQACFWIYLIVVPIFILFALFVPEISPDELSPKRENKSDSEQVKLIEKILSTKVFVSYICLLILVVCMYMSITVKGTFLVTTLGYGNATDGSNILSLIGVGAMIAGFLFGPIFSVTKQWTLPLSFLMMSLAMLVIGLSDRVWITGIGAMICGFAFRTFIPYIFNRVNNDSGQKAASRMSLLLVGFNLGSAFSPYGIALIERISNFLSIRGIFFLEAVLLLLLAVITIGNIFWKRIRIKKL
ncbi:MFS transporter [Enterococcus sp. AZ192]|uniref:MFS transporter n=1 Tax=unclassified Enterococcus TaxID=2608891 RepID=UPI003D2ADE43